MRKYRIGSGDDMLARKFGTGIFEEYERGRYTLPGASTCNECGHTLGPHHGDGACPPYMADGFIPSPPPDNAQISNALKSMRIIVEQL